MNSYLDVITKLVSASAPAAVILAVTAFLIYRTLKKEFNQQKQEIIRSKDETIREKDRVIVAKDELLAIFKNQMEVKEQTLEEQLKTKEELYTVQSTKLQEAIEQKEKQMEEAVGEERRKYQESLVELERRKAELDKLKQVVIQTKLSNAALQKRVQELEDAEKSARTSVGLLSEGLSGKLLKALSSTKMKAFDPFEISDRN